MSCSIFLYGDKISKEVTVAVVLCIFFGAKRCDTKVQYFARNIDEEQIFKIERESNLDSLKFSNQVTISTSFHNIYS